MMRIALFGGTGFVGSHLVDALVAADMQPVLLVRQQSTERACRAGRCEVVTGDLADPAAVAATLTGADAVIYDVGLLREQPRDGATFAEAHHHAVQRVVEAALTAGVRRLLLMSANGVRGDGGAYQRTKRAGEVAVQNSGLDYTIFRPSVIFGEPRGRDEFASRLVREIIDPPLPAPLFFTGVAAHRAGRFLLSPVHVDDVAAAFVQALRDPGTIGRTLHLGGPQSLSWRDILARLAAARGRHKLMLPVPALGVSAAAALFEHLPAFPLTREQLTMLLEGNTCPPDDLVALGIVPRAFDLDHLAYLAKRPDAAG